MGLMLPSLYSELEGEALPHIVDELAAGALPGRDRHRPGPGGRAPVSAGAGVSSAGCRSITACCGTTGRGCRRWTQSCRSWTWRRGSWARGATSGTAWAICWPPTRTESVALHDCDILTYDRSPAGPADLPGGPPAFQLRILQGLLRPRGGRQDQRPGQPPAGDAAAARAEEDPGRDGVPRLHGQLSLPAGRASFPSAAMCSTTSSFPATGGWRSACCRRCIATTPTTACARWISPMSTTTSTRSCLPDDDEGGLSQDVHRHCQGAVPQAGDPRRHLQYRDLPLPEGDLLPHRPGFRRNLPQRRGDERSQLWISTARRRRWSCLRENIMKAGEAFLDRPMERPFIPSWNRVISAIPDILERLQDAVEADHGSSPQPGVGAMSRPVNEQLNSGRPRTAPPGCDLPRQSRWARTWTAWPHSCWTLMRLEPVHGPGPAVTSITGTSAMRIVITYGDSVLRAGENAAADPEGFPGSPYRGAADRRAHAALLPLELR